MVCGVNFLASGDFHLLSLSIRIRTNDRLGLPVVSLADRRKVSSAALETAACDEQKEKVRCQDETMIYGETRVIAKLPRNCEKLRRWQQNCSAEN